MEHVVFLTGRLAEAALEKVLSSLAPLPFNWEIRQIGVQVAALMTTDLISRRLPRPLAADRLILPGRARGDIEALARHYGVPVERGPEDLKDLPAFFNRQARPVDLSRHDIDIFAEIVDAPQLEVDAIVARARRHREDGADVIDLGCLPSTPFPHLEEAVTALKAEGFAVSVDSMMTDELLRGGRAGADYLLSLNLDSLWIADEVASTPILVPREPADLASLFEAVEQLKARGRPCLADPILDPIPFGLMASLERYAELRRRFPDVKVLFGTGNLTELTEADTAGMTAILIGVAVELKLNAILTTQVSGHARRAIREADLARRIMYAARELQTLPKGLDSGLTALHVRHPFPDSAEEILTTASQIRDPSFRIQVSEAGVHVYNRAGHHLANDPFDHFPRLGVESDGGHAFYLGVELARAEIAWQLGKRYVQDQPLDWGCAVDRRAADLDQWCAPGPTKKKPGAFA